MRESIRRHPLASYFILAITISWTGILLIVLPGSIPAAPAEAQRLFLPVYLAMLLGPSVAGLAITGIAGGRAGLRDFRDRLFAWRASAGWYAVVLLVAPVTLGVTLLALSLVSPDFAPSILAGNTDTAGLIRTGGTLAFLLTGVLVGMGAGFFEELGWTGVAVPKMLERRGILATGVGVGLVWGGWHYLAIHWGSSNAIADVPAPVYLLVALFSFLLPYRVLMAWVYRHTRSLPLGILMHMSLTASMLLLGPAVSGWRLLAFDLAFAATLWAAAAIVLLAEARRHRVATLDLRVDLKTA